MNRRTSYAYEAAIRRAGYLSTSIAVIVSASAGHAQQIVIGELWRTKGNPEIGLFVSIGGMAEAPNGSIWVSDPRGGVVFSIDSGLRVRVLARQGKGPGEVEGPSRIAVIPTAGLAIYDLGRYSIEVFGPDGEFERRVTLEVPIWNPKGFTVLPNGEFLLSGGIPGGIFFRRGDIRNGRYGIHHFSGDGELMYSWWPIPETQNPRAGIYVAGGPVAALPDGSILFSDAAPHRILRFSADGSHRDLIASDPELLESVGDNFIHITGSGATRRVSYNWYFPQSRLIGRLPTGHLLNVVEFHDQSRTLFQLYSRDGAFLARAWLNTAYTAWSLTRDGDVLAEWIDPATHESYAVRLEVTYK